MRDAGPIDLSPLEKDLHEFYSGPKPPEEFIAELETRLEERAKVLADVHPASGGGARPQWRAFLGTLRARPVLALVLAVLVLLALTATAYALGRWSGYIPGFGFVSNNAQLYVLSAPAEMEDGAIRLQVSQAVDDGNRFWIDLTVTGVSSPASFTSAFITLADGTRIESDAGRSEDLENGRLNLSYLFPSITKGSKEMTLIVKGLDQHDLSLNLRLQPADSTSLVPTPPDWTAHLESQSNDGVRLVLENVAVDSARTVFQVSVRPDEPPTEIAGPWSVTLTDDAGTSYPLSDVTPDFENDGSTHVYETIPFKREPHLILRLVTFPDPDTLPTFLDLSAHAPSFLFSAGENPVAGTSHDLDQPLEVDGFTLRVVEATLTSDPGVLFTVHADPQVTGVMFYTPTTEASGLLGGSSSPEGTLLSGLRFSHFPDRPIEVRLVRIYSQARGPWEIRWQPPAAPAGTVSMPSPTSYPLPTGTPAPPPALSDPALLEVRRLIQAFNSSLQDGPGWVHVVTETITNLGPGQVFPPPYLKSEQWYEIDTEGFVSRLLWTDFDKSGNVIQQSATVGNHSMNFSTGETSFNPGEAQRISLDDLTLDMITGPEGGDTHLTHEETTCEDGRSCLLMTGWQSYPNPIQNPGESQAFSGAGRRAWIDTQSGQEVMSQSFLWLPDGGMEITSTSRIILVEKAESPPQAILDRLAKVVVP